MTFAIDQPVSPTTERLLRIAEGVSKDGLPADDKPAVGNVPAPLSEFLQTYREWISFERGMIGTPEEQAERWQLLLHCMVTGATLGEAIDLLRRFVKVVLGGRGATGLREEGGAVVLSFEEPFQPGPGGLIAEIWPLAVTLCELEFLSGRTLHDVTGRVRHPASLPDGVAQLLFGPPISYTAGELALVIPRNHLQRAVIARPADLQQFFRQLLPLTLGARRSPPSMQSLVTGLIRDDKLRGNGLGSNLVDVATRLGISATTLRRRLTSEGVSFRQIREHACNAIAKQWLYDGELSIDAIAERLGFCDAFAFRRFFRRMNACSPTAFRSDSINADSRHQ